MKQVFAGIIFFSFVFIFQSQGQTPIPNGDFENWVSYNGYQNPQYWDSPNQSISLALPFGTQVVTKSTDHESGSYSARLESKQLTFPSIIVPGVITLGTLTIDIFNQTYSISGGTPINDKPTHLKVFTSISPREGTVAQLVLVLQNGIMERGILWV